LTEIERGDLLSALEKREGKYGAYTVADYIDQLNGLGCDEVLRLAAQREGGAPQQAPTLAGIWYGVLPPPFRHKSRVVGRVNQRLPLVLEVAIASDGLYSGRVNSLKQGNVIEMTEIVVAGPAVQWRQPSVTGSYEGALDADGTTLHGTWKQTVRSEFDPRQQSLVVMPLVFHKLQIL
jgi:hypothetical protein